MNTFYTPYTLVFLFKFTYNDPLSLCSFHYLFCFTGPGNDTGLFSCESDFDGDDFNKTMRKIETSTSVEEFWKKINNATEKIKGTFFGRGVGLNATANFTAEDGMMKKILNGTELQLSLDINLKIDNVTLSATGIVGNVDKSDFQEQDNVTVCFGKSKDCPKLFNLTHWEAFQKLHDTSEASVSVNNIDAMKFEIKGDEGDLFSLFSKFVNDEEFEIKLTVNGHATSNLKFNIELHGNTTFDDIEKLNDDDEIFDGDILNELTHVEGQICIGTECANFIECSDNLCNHHQENKSTTTTKPAHNQTQNQTNIQTNNQSHNQTHNRVNDHTNNQINNQINIKTNNQTNNQTNDQTHNHKNKHTKHNKHNKHNNHQTKIPKNNNKTATTTPDTKPIISNPDKNKTARGFGYFCAVVIIFAMGGLVFYYYRKRRNGAMSARSEYAELTATHI